MGINLRIIQMHGLGDTAENYLYVFGQSKELLFSQNTKLILLQAPERKVTISFGQSTYSWYDIKNFDFTRDFKDLVNLEEIEQSKQMILKVLDAET